MNKQLKIIVLTVFVLVFSIGNMYAQTEQYQFRHLTTKDGLSSHYVKCIAKDSRGFMWFGTTTGLNRFDGYNIKVFKHDSEDATSLSYNKVVSILEIDNQFILFGTSKGGLNLFNIYTEEFKHFKHDPYDSTSISHNAVNVIFKDQTGVIWIGTSNGVNIFIKESGKFQVIKQVPEEYDSPKDHVNDIFMDINGILWIATNDGLFQLDKSNYSFKNIPLNNKSTLNPESNSVRCITEDQDGMLWIGTFFGLFTYKNDIINYHGEPDIAINPFIWDIEIVLTDEIQEAWIATNVGLHRYDYSNGQFNSFEVVPHNENGLSSNQIIGVYYDDQGSLWVNTYSEGIDIIKLDRNPFIPHLVRDSILQHSARSFAEDKEKNIWVGSNYMGLLMYDSSMNLKYVSNKFRFSNNDVNKDLRTDVVLEDSDGTLWVGVGTGESRICTFNKKNKVYQMVHHDTSEVYKTPYSFNEILEDDSGTLWIAASTGLFLAPRGPDWDSLIHIIDHKALSHTFIHDLHKDSKGNIWIASDSGLFCTKKIIGETLQFDKYNYEKRKIDRRLLLPIYVHESSNGTIWVGSTTLCKADRDKKVFRAIETSDELLSWNMIISIKEDKKGYLWLSTWKGLIRFDPNRNTSESTRLFNLSDGLPYDGYFRTHMYQNSEGVIFMPANYGTGDGFYCFNPNRVPVNMTPPTVVITDLKIHNLPIKLDSSINAVKHIQLDHNQNFLSFEFAALDYTDPAKNQYAYMLEGIDNDWVYSGNRRFVNYSGTPPGKYIFRVKGSNNDGFWNKQGTSLIITIHSPPWRSWWAYSIYTIIILFLLFFWRKYDLKRYRLKKQLEIEKLEKDKLSELDSMKSQFFANVSHEFRTPLTLILGPLKNLRNEVSSAKGKNDLNIIQRNSIRLQQLINQLLNLSKLESGKMKLQAAYLDINQMVRIYTQNFKSLANQKEIHLQCVSDIDEIFIWVDKDKIEKILYNLISNAFNYTTRNGSITIGVHKEENKIKISVSDTGVGIKKDNLPHIFDRFYQADNSHKSDTEGSGIGLALVKQLVELHHGNISVSSAEGKGSIFSIFLQLGDEHLNNNEKLAEADKEKNNSQSMDIQNPVEEYFTNNIVNETAKQKLLDKSKPILLVVEDNADLRFYIHGQLEENYNIIEAKDGKQGFSLAIDLIPDLILSDVMMPEMDGYELCANIKMDERTSHIPLILLTAKAATENKLEGLETGADDFITKPFDPEELHIRISNLIRQRKKLKEKFLRDIRMDKIRGKNTNENDDDALVSIDQKFLIRAREVVINYLSDESFDVTTFSSDMNLGRTQLHRKLRALIDQSATEFIRTVRINQAATFLRHKTGNISEIALKVGFSNPGYFAECFKKQFGILPSVYAKKFS